MPLELSTAAFLMERKRASKQKLYLPARLGALQSSVIHTTVTLYHNM